MAELSQTDLPRYMRQAAAIQRQPGSTTVSVRFACPSSADIFEALLERAMRKATNHRTRWSRRPAARDPQDLNNTSRN